jgi:diaminohydroxyphosphoribosylaminopyrimidine deaminase / 5-amino-6-(5-phosphoribosylamino)uracil reductase
MNLTAPEQFMHRCLELARPGRGRVAPNPMVGAVLVHDGRIIGEGYHQQFGGPHAEVNCLASVKDEYRHFIKESTLYVSLEPCAHFGKTPPCTDLIISQRIPEVVIGCRDPFEQVNGKGIEKLRAAGISVTMSSLETECENLNKSFFTFHKEHRPYIILKWAQTADRKIANNTGERLYISNAQTNRLVHQWRSEEASILVGANTALADDPSLTNRLAPGNTPLRLVLDKALKVPATSHLLDGAVPTIVFNLLRHSIDQAWISNRQGVAYYKMEEDRGVVQQMMDGLYTLGINSVMVEGGSRLLQSFIDEEYWDEARIITNHNLFAGPGLAAPQLDRGELQQQFQFHSDEILIYHRTLS